MTDQKDMIIAMERERDMAFSMAAILAVNLNKMAIAYNRLNLAMQGVDDILGQAVKMGMLSETARRIE